MTRTSRLTSRGSRYFAAAAFVGIVAAVLAPMPASADKGGARILTNDYVAVSSQYPAKQAVYYGGDHANDVTVDVGGTDIVFTDPNAVGLSTSAPCTLVNSTTVTCPKTDGAGDTNKIVYATVLGYGGDDTLTAEGWSWVDGSSYTPIRTTLNGFAGDDTITANGGYSHLYGHDGNDTITSGPGTTTGAAPWDIIEGMNGDDTIDTATNSTDRDGIHCDNNGSFSYTNWLTRESDDVDTYYAIPFPTFGGCDNVTVV